MKINDRVITPDGVGTIVKIENICSKLRRAGVRHDIKPKGFKNEILYYFFKELERINT